MQKPVLVLVVLATLFAGDRQATADVLEIWHVGMFGRGNLQFSSP